MVARVTVKGTEELTLTPRKVLSFSGGSEDLDVGSLELECCDTETVGRKVVSGDA